MTQKQALQLCLSELRNTVSGRLSLRQAIKAAESALEHAEYEDAHYERLKAIALQAIAVQSFYDQKQKRNLASAMKELDRLLVENAAHTLEYRMRKRGFEAAFKEE